MERLLRSQLAGSKCLLGEFPLVILVPEKGIALEFVHCLASLSLLIVMLCEFACYA